MTDKIPLKLVDLGSGAGELREFATTDTIPTSNLNATTSATDTTTGRVWRTNDLVKTTSATDTTAGRMLKVGDFGLGSSAPPLSDLNTGNSGFYSFYNTALNRPCDYGRLFISGGNEAAQIAVNILDGALYSRKYQSGVGWSAWAEVATSANSLGQGQAWQDMTGSRAFSTAYTNSTGRPIQVTAQVTSSAKSGFSMYVSGLIVDTTSLATAGDVVSLSAIVPNGATYFIGAGAGTPSVITWSELR